MTYDLFDITKKTAMELNVATYSKVVSSSSDTTFVDTTRLTQDDDYWNGGSVWIIEDAGGAAAAPEGEYFEVSDFVNSTSTVTFTAASSTRLAANDKYLIADDEFPLEMMISQVNLALHDMGPILNTNSTKVTIAANQTEYTLPAEIVSGDNLRACYLQRDQNDSDDNLWVEILNWDIEHEAIGTAPTLILPYQYGTGYAVKLEYVAPHIELWDADDQLSEFVPMELLVPMTTLNCLRWAKQEYRRDDYDDQILKYEVKVERAKQQYGLAPRSKPRKIMTVRRQDDSNYTGDVDAVRL